MPHFDVFRSAPDFNSLYHYITSPSVTSSWTDHLKHDLPDKCKCLDFDVDYSLQSNGLRRALFKIELHNVPHTAWDTLLENIRNDNRFEVPPLYKTSGRDGTYETVMFPTGYSLSEHLGFNSTYFSRILSRTISFSNSDSYSLLGSTVSPILVLLVLVY